MPSPFAEGAYRSDNKLGRDFSRKQAHWQMARLLALSVNEGHAS